MYHKLFVIKNVWHPGCSTVSCFFLRNKINNSVISLEKNQINATYHKFLLKQKERLLLGYVLIFLLYISLNILLYI